MFLNDVITGLVVCATGAERNACYAVTDLQASKSRTIVLLSTSLGINGSDQKYCVKSLKILSAQECGDELISGITGSWSVIDR